MNSDWKIRIATEKDLDCILSHRRGMFEEMGFNDPIVLDQVVAASRDFIKKGLATGSYRGFLAVTGNNQVIAGTGLASRCSSVEWTCLSSAASSSGTRHWIT